MRAKKKLVKTKEKPEAQQRIQRPDAEQLALLEKAIYHSFKLTFTPDASGASNMFFDGEPVKSAKGDQVDLNKFFKLIVQTYSTL